MQYPWVPILRFLATGACLSSQPMKALDLPPTPNSLIPRGACPSDGKMAEVRRYPAKSERQGWFQLRDARSSSPPHSRTQQQSELLSGYQAKSFLLVTVLVEMILIAHVLHPSTSEWISGGNICSASIHAT